MQAGLLRRSAERAAHGGVPRMECGTQRSPTGAWSCPRETPCRGGAKPNDTPLVAERRREETDAGPRCHGSRREVAGRAGRGLRGCGADAVDKHCMDNHIPLVSLVWRMRGWRLGQLQHLRWRKGCCRYGRRLPTLGIQSCRLGRRCGATSLFGVTRWPGRTRGAGVGRELRLGCQPCKAGGRLRVGRANPFGPKQKEE